MAPAAQAYPASRLTDMASDWLARRYPGALIVRELSVGTWGSALIDIAAILPDRIVGVEVKGDGDSTTRLKLQTALYSKAAQEMYLLPAPSLASRCERVRWGGWGLLGVVGEDVRVVAKAPSSEPNASPLPTAPFQILQALWADELHWIAGAGVGGSCEGLRRYLAAERPLKQLIPDVCNRLRARNWDKFGLGHKVRWAEPKEEAGLLPQNKGSGHV